MSEQALANRLLQEQRENARVTLKKLLLIIPVMLVFCASMVPLYRQICEVLGITATKAIAQNTQVDTSRTVIVEFDSNVSPHFAWRFEPVEKRVEINPGAMVTINYRVTNTLPYATTGRAVPSFGPLEAGLYFNKIACFCFSNQTLQAGETRDMPVTFFVDPKLPKDIGSIALSYTFFNVTEGQK
ncbi:MAG: cytochrome c oxidase assembly protein [Betaproteobacteria bacterium]